MRIHVGSTNPVKQEAVRRAFKRVFPDAELETRLLDVSTHLTEIPEQPFDGDVARGALGRAKAALRDADFGVGIEAGLIWSEPVGAYFDVQYCAVIDRHGQVTVGHGPGFVYPDWVIGQVLADRTVGEAMEARTGIENIGRRLGAIGYLSDGLIDRTQLTEQAVLMALLPRIRPERYREA